MIQIKSGHIELIGGVMELTGVIIFTFLYILAMERNEFALLFFNSVPIILILVIIGGVISITGAAITPIGIKSEWKRKSENLDIKSEGKE